MLRDWQSILDRQSKRAAAACIQPADLAAWLSRPLVDVRIPCRSQSEFHGWEHGLRAQRDKQHALKWYDVVMSRRTAFLDRAIPLPEPQSAANRAASNAG